MVYTWWVLSGGMEVGGGNVGGLQGATWISGFG